MFERDYIMRQIQILAQALARTLVLRSQQNIEDAIRELDQAFATYANLSPERFHTLTIDQVIALCSNNGNITDEEACLLANLLQEQGDMLLQQEQERLAVGNYMRALALYLEVLSDPEATIPVDLHDRIAYLVEQTHHAVHPNPVAKRLVAYLTVRQRYADAEDVLFHWAANDPTAATDPGWEFFGRLLAKSDRELRKGGLSKREVREGMQAFREELAAS